MSGRAVVGLFERGERLAEHLAKIPHETKLVDAREEELAALYELQGQLDEVPDVGHVTRSKLLARKRPHLVPIRDQHVLRALLGADQGPLTAPLRSALASAPSITERLAEIRELSGAPATISDLRVLDVVVWMTVHGDAQVSDEVQIPNN